MVLVLKKGASKKEIATIEKKLFKQKSEVGFDARKYNGVIKLKEGDLDIQKRLREDASVLKHPSAICTDIPDELAI